ncbi:MAG TPA: hypothetical protein VM487_07555 [Phycisphaerae bacterium]|nr:hypothetical protein [Phycisphaerae bacterium]
MAMTWRDEPARPTAVDPVGDPTGLCTSNAGLTIREEIAARLMAVNDPPTARAACDEAESLMDEFERRGWRKADCRH